MSEGAAPSREVTEVAVGVLLRPDDAVLLADRPQGKPYAGYWEFPGGKIEPGESVEHALARELHEELGIDIGPALPWVTFEFDYPHAYVRLHFCRIFCWSGTPQGREGQRLAFFRLHDQPPEPLLPAAAPALRWLALPSLAAQVGLDEQAPDALLAQLDVALAHGLRLLVLRSSDNPAGFDRRAADTLVREIAARCGAFNATVLVADSRPPADHFRVDGIHLTEPLLLQARSRPDASWVGAEVGSRHTVERAARLGCDFVVAGPVLPTPIGGSVQAPVGWHGFAALARHAPLPVFACGGLAVDDLDRARHAGAHGLMLTLPAWRERFTGGR